MQVLYLHAIARDYCFLPKNSVWHNGISLNFTHHCGHLLSSTVANNS